MTPLKFIKQIWSEKDVSSFAMLLLITLVAGWILALPFSRTVQDAYLHRFHLATPSFHSWAMQQTVPSMYNLENRYWCCSGPVENVDELWSGSDRSLGLNGKSSMANHFPTRVMTFGDARRFIRMNNETDFYIESAYRGRILRSIYELTPISDTQYELKRKESILE